MSQRFLSTDNISVGDLITKLYGTKSIRVIEIHGKHIYGEYVDSGRDVYALCTCFKPYKNNDQTIMSKEQLFTWTDPHGQYYGTYLATNSSGQYVLEVKKTGNIVTMHPDQVEEVIPWTFSAKNGSTEEHFTGPDTIKKGDSLIQILTSQTPRVWFVTDVDTKSRTATKFVGRRIVTEEI